MTIFICGLPRTGKTTLAKMLKARIDNSNLIVTESIRNGFQKIDKEHSKDWGTKSSKLRQAVFPLFVKEFLDWNEKFSSNITILDCALISLQQIEKLANKDDIIVCLGFGGRENNEIFLHIRQYEHNDDYTKTYSNDYLLKLWGDLSTLDKCNYDFCNKKGIKYFDTSLNRRKVQLEITKYIKRQLKKYYETIKQTKNSVT